MGCSSRKNWRRNLVTAPKAALAQHGSHRLPHSRTASEIGGRSLRVTLMGRPAWRHLLPLGLALAGPLAAQATGGAPMPPFFAGWHDHAWFETWTRSFEGRFRAGIVYRYRHRGTEPLAACDAQGAEFASGCRAAEQRLADFERRGREDAAYAEGWQAWRPGARPPTNR